MGDLVRHFDFEGVVTERNAASEGDGERDLFAVAADGAGSFGGGPDSFLSRRR